MMQTTKKSANRNKVKMFVAQKLKHLVHWNIQADLHHFQSHFHIALLFLFVFWNSRLHFTIQYLYWGDYWHVLFKQIQYKNSITYWNTIVYVAILQNSQSFICKIKLCKYVSTIAMEMVSVFLLFGLKPCLSYFLPNDSQ